MIKPESPCRDCPLKGCGPYHSTCPSFTQFQDELDSYNTVIKTARNNSYIQFIEPRNLRKHNDRKD